jgi:hypothetical protein
MNQNITILSILISPKSPLPKYHNYFFKLLLIKYFPTYLIKSENYQLIFQLYFKLNKLTKKLNLDKNYDLFDIYITDYICIEGSSLKSIPSEINILSNLSILIIETSRLKTISKNIGLLNKLEKLIIKNAPIKILPNNINLKYLEVFHSQIKIISDNIGLLTNILTLKLANNNIKILSTFIGLLNNLTYLTLSENK